MSSFWDGEECVQNCAHKVFKCLKGKKIRGSRTSKWNSFHSSSTSTIFSIKEFLSLFLPLIFTNTHPLHKYICVWYQINRVLYNTMILLKMLSAFHMLCICFCKHKRRIQSIMFFRTWSKGPTVPKKRLNSNLVEYRYQMHEMMLKLKFRLALRSDRNCFSFEKLTKNNSCVW